MYFGPSTRHKTADPGIHACADAKLPTADIQPFRRGLKAQELVSAERISGNNPKIGDFHLPAAVEVRHAERNCCDEAGRARFGKREGRDFDPLYLSAHTRAQSYAAKGKVIGFAAGLTILQHKGDPCNRYSEAFI